MRPVPVPRNVPTADSRKEAVRSSWMKGLSDDFCWHHCQDAPATVNKAWPSAAHLAGKRRSTFISRASVV